MKKREEIEKKLGLNLCPIRTVLAQIGDKWSLLVILQLRAGGQRFLAITARHSRYFAKNAHRKPYANWSGTGLFSRKVTPSTPPRVDYGITALGQSLFEHIGQWRNGRLINQPDILKASDQFDRQH